MTDTKKADEKSAQVAASYLDFWEENLTLLATHGLDEKKKAKAD